MNIYIVGGGSFAQQCYHAFHRTLSVIGFIDEFREEPLYGLPVYTANKIHQLSPGKETYFFLCISDVNHSKAAITRLLDQGVKQQNIFALENIENCLWMMELESENYPVFKTLLEKRITNYTNLMEHFPSKFHRRYLADKRFKDGPHFSASFYGPALGYRQHMMPILKRVYENYNVTTISDQELLDEDSYLNPITGVPLTDLPKIEGFDFAMTAQFTHTSPPDTPRITFMHILGDMFFMYYKAVTPYIFTTKKHYLFIPNVYIFNELKEIFTEQTGETNFILIPGGYPNLDNNYKYLKRNPKDKDSIIYAPTWSCSGTSTDKTQSTDLFSMGQAADILQALSQTYPDYTIIFRPHPGDIQCIEAGRKTYYIEDLRKALEICQTLPNCILDKEAGYVKQYSRCICMVSDISSTAYTFSFITEQPVVFFAPSNRDTPKHVRHSNYFIDREKIGALAYDMRSLIEQVAYIIEHQDRFREQIIALRSQSIFNFEHSVDYFMDNISYIIDDKKHPDWWYSKPTE